MSIACREIQGGLCEITQDYKAGVHDGIDIVNKDYTLGNIVAHSDGTVVATRNDITGFVGGGSYGNYVKIKHDNGYYTLYAHGKYNSVSVKTGQRVNKNQVIMAMGATGTSYGGHLHFEIRNTSDVRINPTPYLNSDLPNNTPSPSKSIDELAKEVIDGKWGNNPERKQRLEAAGYNYGAVQNRVNEMLAPKPEPKKGHSIGDMVTINGVYVSSDSTNRLYPAIKQGTITRIIEGARNPYLLDNGNIGWINDDCIVNSTQSGSVVYEVKPGDSLSLIAAKYNTTWQNIYEKNAHIIGSNPNLIQPGMILTF